MKSIFAAVAVVLAAAFTASAALPPELDARAQEALRRGADWLAALQQPDGHWDMPETPALSALAFLALHRDPARRRTALALLVFGAACLAVLYNPGIKKLFPWALRRP